MKLYSITRLLGVLPVATLLQTLPLNESFAAETGQPLTDEVQRNRYVDGTFTATGKYGGQPSFLTVTVTLKDDIITSVKVGTHAYVPRSLELQRAFAAAVPQVVVGRRIDQVKVGKLAGSSGTPVGFNNAITQIKKQAARP